jgi:hypothetical protein
MCPLHVIKKLKADRISGSFNTEGTHPANSRQIKQDYTFHRYFPRGQDLYIPLPATRMEARSPRVLPEIFDDQDA